MRENNAENTGDVEEETDRIDGEEDEIRERERCLWNDIKTKSVTRLVATVYAHTIVFLVLTVQVNLLGGRLLREEREERESNGGRSANPTTTSGADRYRTSHQTVLARTYKYLFSRGIPLLAETAGAAVDEILRDWDVLDDDATLGDVSSWMESVRERMEHHDRKDEGTSPLVKFIIPPEGETDDAAAAGGGGPDSHTHPDELAGYILDETYDLLESPAFADAERRCLDATFGQLRTNVLGRMFLLEDDVPLATVVTHFQKTAVTTFHRPPSHEEEMGGGGGVLGMMEEPLPSSVPNEYVSRLERLDAVLELSDVCF